MLLDGSKLSLPICHGRRLVHRLYVVNLDNTFPSLCSRKGVDNSRPLSLGKFPSDIDNCMGNEYGQALPSCIMHGRNGYSSLLTRRTNGIICRTNDYLHPHHCLRLRGLRMTALLARCACTKISRRLEWTSFRDHNETELRFDHPLLLGWFWK